MSAAIGWVLAGVLYAGLTTWMASIGTYPVGDIDRPRRGGWVAGFVAVLVCQAIALGIGLAITVVVYLIMSPSA